MIVSVQSLCFRFIFVSPSSVSSLPGQHQDRGTQSALPAPAPLRLLLPGGGRPPGRGLEQARRGVHLGRRGGERDLPGGDDPPGPRALLHQAVRQGQQGASLPRHGPVRDGGLRSTKH